MIVYYINIYVAVLTYVILDLSISLVIDWSSAHKEHSEAKNSDRIHGWMVAIFNLDHELWYSGGTTCLTLLVYIYIYIYIYIHTHYIHNMI